MSNEYQNILVAIDLSEDSRLVLKRAKEIAARNQEAKLSVVHTLEPLGFAYGGDIPMDLTSIQEQLDEHAHKRMAELIKDFDIPEENQHILVGMPDSETHRLAEENKVDLIVVGSHGRHGLQLLLGSVSSGVLHGAPCDVLAVRVGKDK
ncbi:universal stress protein [Marinospirillum sp.]|jgi:universal stress protein A|uniref:universal stress protein n=1 Tax=Marinospirillum sp. TaxID=2183934 RepID=UPI00286FED0E|nr:universal stress protein [Marinospirillum sp.]MDR9467853.1 universal stress protein [Marinospirillum sp.]